MSAGQPDWVKLAAMGKLPEHGKKYVPFLAEAEEAANKVEPLEAEIKELKAENKRLKGLLTKNGIDYKTKEEEQPVLQTTGVESTPAIT